MGQPVVRQVLRSVAFFSSFICQALRMAKLHQRYIIAFHLLYQLIWNLFRSDIRHSVFLLLCANLNEKMIKNVEVWLHLMWVIQQDKPMSDL